MDPEWVSPSRKKKSKSSSAGPSMSGPGFTMPLTGNKTLLLGVSCLQYIFPLLETSNFQCWTKN